LRKLLSSGRRFKDHPLHDSIFPVISAFTKENSREQKVKKTKEEDGWLFLMIWIAMVADAREVKYERTKDTCIAKLRQFCGGGDQQCRGCAANAKCLRY
jgi:hypothetical protein